MHSTNTLGLDLVLLLLQLDGMESFNYFINAMRLFGSVVPKVGLRSSKGSQSQSEGSLEGSHDRKEERKKFCYMKSFSSSFGAFSNLCCFLNGTMYEVQGRAINSETSETR